MKVDADKSRVVILRKSGIVSDSVFVTNELKNIEMNMKLIYLLKY